MDSGRRSCLSVATCCAYANAQMWACGKFWEINTKSTPRIPSIRETSMRRRIIGIEKDATFTPDLEAVDVDKKSDSLCFRFPDRELPAPKGSESDDGTSEKEVVKV